MKDDAIAATMLFIVIIAFSVMTLWLFTVPEVNVRLYSTTMIEKERDFDAIGLYPNADLPTAYRVTEPHER